MAGAVVEELYRILLVLAVDARRRHHRSFDIKNGAVPVSPLTTSHISPCSHSAPPDIVDDARPQAELVLILHLQMALPKSLYNGTTTNPINPTEELFVSFFSLSCKFSTCLPLFRSWSPSR